MYNGWVVAAAKTRRIFYGWWLLFLGCLILAVGSGILYQGFTVFFLPLKRDLVLSSAAVSLLYGAARLEGGAEGPLVGYLIDRIGPRAMILFGVSLAGVGFVLLSFVQSFWSFFFVYIFIVSLGFNSGFWHPIYAVVNSWFVRNRGVAFAMTGVASSVGGMVMAPLLSYVILSFGWRTAAVIAGLLILGFCLPCALPIRRTPEEVGFHPDGMAPPERPAAQAAGARAGPGSEWSLKQALASLDYWLLFCATALRVLVTVALTIHFVPMLVWKGMSELASAYLVSLFAAATIVTTLISGWLGDRYNKSLLCAAGTIPTLLAMAVLWFSESPAAPYALPLGLALAMGVVPLNWALIGDLFGRHSYATLRGFLGIGTGAGAFVSPVYAGWVFDRSGSYAEALLTFIAVHAAAGALFLLLCRRNR